MCKKIQGYKIKRKIGIREALGSPTQPQIEPGRHTAFLIPIELVKVSALHSFIFAFSLANSLAACRFLKTDPTIQWRLYWKTNINSSWSLIRFSISGRGGSDTGVYVSAFASLPRLSHTQTRGDALCTLGPILPYLRCVASIFWMMDISILIPSKVPEGLLDDYKTDGQGADIGSRVKVAEVNRGYDTKIDKFQKPDPWWGKKS